MTNLFQSGQGYSVLNTARSALSTFIVSPTGLTIGNSPLVKRFMKGVFELRPSIPRYKYIWDVSIVLNFIGNFYPNEDLSLPVLSFKCVMLLALSSMQRVQTLKAINVTSIKFFTDSVLIPIKSMLKQFRVNKNSLSIILNVFPHEPAICPCATLRHYIARTKSLRKTTTQLFISFHKPYQAVSCDTLSRWIKRVMFESGIDTDLFKAHSTRAAASSAARDSQLPTNDILKIAGWANATTFRKFYDKTII